MSSIPLSARAVAAVKADLVKCFDECKSSHLSEALAYALGFNTNAALQQEIRTQGVHPFHFFVDEERLTKRLNDFGYAIDEGFYFWPDDIPEMRLTNCMYAGQIEYKTKRHIAWRNLLVATVNEALRLRLFSLHPRDNRWPSHDDRNSQYSFEFFLPTGDKAFATISDAGYDEIAIDVIVNPKSSNHVPAYYAGLKDGDAVAMTWLERKEGAWLQSALDSFRCRNALLPKLSSMDVVPMGYGDRGVVK